MAKNYHFGVVVGRFQPLHNGHCSVIDLAIANCDRVAVFVGSAQESGTKKNPLSYDFRSILLSERYGDAIEIYPLNDLTDGSNVTGDWGKYLLAEIEKATGEKPNVFFSGAEPIREKWFYPEDVVNIDEIVVDRNVIPISATEIREMILYDEFEKCASYVPLSTMMHIHKIQEILYRVFINEASDVLSRIEVLLHNSEGE